MTADTARTRQLRADLVHALIEKGLLPSTDWQGAFGRVPRHLFVPSFHRYTGTSLTLIDSALPEHHDEWLAARTAMSCCSSSATPMTH